MRRASFVLRPARYFPTFLRFPMIA
jgi:hypothetical protein